MTLEYNYRVYPQVTLHVHLLSLYFKVYLLNAQ